MGQPGLQRGVWWLVGPACIASVSIYDGSGLDEGFVLPRNSSPDPLE